MSGWPSRTTSDGAAGARRRLAALLAERLVAGYVVGVLIVGHRALRLAIARFGAVGVGVDGIVAILGPLDHRALAGVIWTAPRSDTSAPSSNAVWPPNGSPVPDDACDIRLLGLK